MGESKNAERVVCTNPACRKQQKRVFRSGEERLDGEHGFLPCACGGRVERVESRSERTRRQAAARDFGAMA